MAQLDLCDSVGKIGLVINNLADSHSIMGITPSLPRPAPWHLLPTRSTS